MTQQTIAADTSGTRDVPDGTRTPGMRERARNTARSPRLYLGTGLGASLGTASVVLSGQPQTVTLAAATAVAAGWSALGMYPGPWRWLPGQGEPWEWMCRRSRRGYRRTVRRMRRRLTTPHTPVPVTDPDTGLLDVAHQAGSGWYTHPDRRVLLREATTGARRARCAMLRSVWSRLLPDWEKGWWRPYRPVEMVVRAGPLAAVPASGYASLSLSGSALLVSAAAGWGWWVWDKPDPRAPRVAEVPVPDAADDVSWYRAQWQQHIAREAGVLPHSYLTGLTLTDGVLRAVIVSPVQPADTITQKKISMVWDVAPRAVNMYQSDDMPASRAKLTVTLTPHTSSSAGKSLAEEWSENNPYPGSTLDEIQDTEFGKRFQITLPRKGTSPLQVTPRDIAQALDMQGENVVEQLHVQGVDARRVRVDQMERHPLQDGVPLDLDQLVMDDQGYVTVGRDMYGNPTKWRLLKPDTKRRGLSGRASASAVHSFGSGTTGAGKTSLEEDLLIAQRVNGFVSWLADGKGGAGYASWQTELDWFVKSAYGAMLMAQADTRVSDYRYAVQMKMLWLDDEGYKEKGRSFFVPHEPFNPMVTTFDEFNEMVMNDPRADHVAPLLQGVSSSGRLSRASGKAVRVWLQIPNLGAIGSNENANAVRDMLQSGNIALFRTARADVDAMSLGSRQPEFRLTPIPERFPNGKGTEGVCYIADGSAQFTQSRAAFHSNPARVHRGIPGPLPTLNDGEADAAGPVYLRRDEYRQMDAQQEERFLRELVKEEAARRHPNRTVIDVQQAQHTAPVVDDDEDVLEDIGMSRSDKILNAIDQGACRNKDIADTSGLSKSNVSNGLKHLERIGKVRRSGSDWQLTTEHTTALV